MEVVALTGNYNIDGMITTAAAASLTTTLHLPTYLSLSLSLAGIQGTAGSRAVPLGPTPKVRRDLKGKKLLGWVMLMLLTTTTKTLAVV